MLPCVSGNECIGVLVKSGFDATEEHDGIVWLERDACGVAVPREDALDARELAAILDSARIDDDRFRDLLRELRQAGQASHARHARHAC